MGNAFAKLTFSELTPILAFAKKQQRLEIDDLPPVQDADTCHAVLVDFAGVWQRSKGWWGAEHPGLRFIQAVAFHFKGLLGAVLVLRVVNDMLSFAGPLALEQIIGWLMDPAQRRPWWEPAGLPQRWRGIYYVAVMSATSLAGTFMGVQEQALGMTMGSQVSTWARAEIYVKALRQKTHVRAQVTSGQVINLMSMDAGFLREIPRQIPRIPRCIVKAGIGIALLVRLMGKGAVGAGVSVMVAFCPLGYLGISRLDFYNDKYASKRDKRQGQMSEMLSAIKLVKLNGWEDGMRKNIAKTRKEELDRMWFFQIADHFTGAVWRVMPVATVLTTFGVYTWLGNTLTPQVTFTALALLDEIRAPILSVGEVVADLVRGWTAICRVSEFLEAEELDEHAVCQHAAGDESTNAIEIAGGKFVWGVKPVLRLGEDSDDDDDEGGDDDDDGKEEEGGDGGGDTGEDGEGDDGSDDDESSSSSATGRVSFRLDSVDLTVPTGSLIAVVGPVGSGKTSLLHALLGEMDCEGKPVVIRGTVAFASQSPFVVNATLRDNIAFGGDVDAKKGHYEACIKACALQQDLDSMKKGDKTEIGESGETISGGQKQRLSLARVAFADADVVLLDDCLSAVDASVGAHIWQHCISDRGLMKGKTRILVTHALQYLHECDTVFVMDKGAIVERGTLDELLSSKAPVLCSLMATYDENKKMVQSFADTTGNTGASDGDADKGSSAEDKTPVDGVKATEGSAESSDADSDDGGSSDDELTGEEDRGQGDVKVGPIWKYIQAAGIPHSIGMLGFFVTDVGMQAISSEYTSHLLFASGLLSDRLIDTPAYWLVWWGANRFMKSTSWYMIGLTTISLMEIGFIGGQQILRSFSSIRASVRLHDGMITSLLYSPLSFFHKTPQGRIMHRFGDALEEIDDCFHLDLFEMLENGIRAVGTILVCLTANPRFTAVLPFLCIVFWRIHTFTKTGFLEVDRLRETLYSPIMSHFGETLKGCVTIRAFEDSARFIKKSHGHMDKKERAVYSQERMRMWLDVRMQCGVACPLIAFSTLLAILGRRTSSNMSVAAAGLAIQYAGRITDELISVVENFTWVGAQCVGIEKVCDYIDLPSEEEAAPEADRVTPPADWPSAGRLVLRDVTLSYRPGLEPALKGISCTINAGEHIGIVGRTGAGKSSLTLAILRMADSVGGLCEIDGLDTSTIPLSTLRRRVAIIPQEATMFAGDIRHNLDPLGKSTDDVLTAALDQVSLSETVKTAGGLDGLVSEDGANFSHGQRQLFGVARALLKKSSVVMLDEATASCDSVTDANIQAVIRRVFKHCTVLTIAHRLNTVADSDRIMVIDAGAVAEFDTPEKLLAIPGSKYAALINEAAA